MAASSPLVANGSLSDSGGMAEEDAHFPMPGIAMPLKDRDMPEISVEWHETINPCLLEAESALEGLIPDSTASEGVK